MVGSAPGRSQPTSRGFGIRASRNRPERLSTGEPVRAFVALNFPDRLQRELWDALAPLRERPEKLPVKWVRPENIHLSLKFLGDVEETREPELVAALKRAAGAGHEPRPLTLQITGFGVFPDYHRPHVLWAGVTPDPGLELLQHGVEQAFAPLGFPTEARAFRPHVTLGRAARDARPRDFTGLAEILAGADFDATVTVTEVDLMQSTLQPTGPVYQVKAHGRLS